MFEWKSKVELLPVGCCCSIFCCCLYLDSWKKSPRIAFRFPSLISLAWISWTLTPLARRKFKQAWMLCSIYNYTFLCFIIVSQEIHCNIQINLFSVCLKNLLSNTSINWRSFFAHIFSNFQTTFNNIKNRQRPSKYCKLTIREDKTENERWTFTDTGHVEQTEKLT